MSNCPNCGFELPPITEEDFKMVQEALLANKDFMRQLGQQAAEAYLPTNGLGGSE